MSGPVYDTTPYCETNLKKTAVNVVYTELINKHGNNKNK